MDHLLAEARTLADRGVKELIVIAQDITRYGMDLGDGSSLAGLLKELCKLDFHWIRLHYLYPEVITDELIQVIATQPKILHYLDIPIQHCNDNILKAMRRQDTKAELLDLLAQLRSRTPGLVLRTSLIPRLPGDAEAELLVPRAFPPQTLIARLCLSRFPPTVGRHPDRLAPVPP